LKPPVAGGNEVVNVAIGEHDPRFDLAAPNVNKSHVAILHKAAQHILADAQALGGLGDGTQCVDHGALPVSHS
jgi:hypothetical protein